MMMAPTASAMRVDRALGDEAEVVGHPPPVEPDLRQEEREHEEDPDPDQRELEAERDVRAGERHGLRLPCRVATQHQEHHLDDGEPDPDVRLGPSR